MKQSRWVLIAAILASSMAFIDGSALNVAMPSLQKSLHASGSQLLWILNAYLLVLAAFILPGGALGDKLGRKKVFMLGIAVFTVASLGCGLAWNSGVLIAMRVLQGFGGAFMIPGSLSLINATVPENERGAAIGSWSAATTLVTLAAPVLGGTLADWHFWRGVFFLNLPLALLALWILNAKVPESRNPNASGRIDFMGAILLVIGLGTLSYGILNVPNLGVQHWGSTGMISAGALVLLGFACWEANTPNPILPLKLFTSRAFTGSNLLTLFLYGALSAGMFFLSLNLVEVQGYSQLQAGLSSLPTAILLSTFSRKVGALSDRWGARHFLIAGPALAGLGFWLLGLQGWTHGAAQYWVTYFPGLFTFGLGMTLTVAPLTTTVLATAPSEYSGTASGVNNAVSRTAGVLAIAAIGAIVLSSFQHHLVQLTAALPLSSLMREQLATAAAQLANTQPPSGLNSALNQQIYHAVSTAFIASYQQVMQICAALAWISALIASVWIHNPKESQRSDSIES